jgi:hypoxanthine-DNA glycosylase
MSTINGFAPVSSPDAELLILGSMPGVASLRQQQYYAHARNAFWPIVAKLYGFSPENAYAERCRALLARRVAVWDVLQSCTRPGSLDASIVPSSVQVNDFGAFFKSHPAIRLICFNGGAAEQAYRRHVLPTLADPVASIALRRLPSTSPAHAAMNLQEKTRAWRDALGR